MAKPHTASAPAAAAAPAPVPNPAPSAPVQTAEAARMAYKFAIEDDVPIPEKRIGAKGTTTYPFAVLGIGQSFFVPVTENSPEPWKTITSLASRMTREHWPKKFVTAREAATDKKPEGVRVWRSADGVGELAEPKPRGKRAAKEGSAEALAAEAEAGDTSNKQPEPDFT